MRLRKSILILGVVLLLFGAAFNVSAATTGTAAVSVTIQSVALLAVSTTTPPSFTINGTGTVAGGMPTINPAGTPTFLQYTVVAAAADAMIITAHSSAAMPPGIKLDIWSAPPTGTGGVGTAVTGGLSITSGYTALAASNLISGITSCATGSGPTQGPVIYYTLSIDSATFASMVPGVTPVTITYTLVDGTP